MLSSQSKKGATLTFRHFNRKGYALFSCLGREVRVGVLGVATLLSATPHLRRTSTTTTRVSTKPLYQLRVHLWQQMLLPDK